MTMLSIQSQLSEQRAAALLTVRFTTRDDIAFYSIEDSGFDFIVTLAKNGQTTARMFAIQLKAMSSSKADKPSVSIRANELSRYQDIAFPLCLVTFLMSTDKGYFTWLVEPTYSSLGQPRLSTAYPGDLEVTKRENIAIGPDKFTELTNESLDGLIAAVNKWYDAREQFSGDYGAIAA